MSLDPISAAFDLGNTLISRIFPDPAQANEAKLELLKLQQSGELATMTAQDHRYLQAFEINQLEFNI